MLRCLRPKHMFTHLHLHTEFSLLDGLSRIPDVMDRVAALGQQSVAITDHGALYGAIDFYKEARARGIKPIIGIEAYVAPDSRHKKSDSRSNNYYHLTLLAKDEAGYRNLLQLSTRSHLEGFYYKPRMDKELLAEYGKGIIALSGCPSGEMFKLLNEDRDDEARQLAGFFSDVFDGFYLEVMQHDEPDINAQSAKAYAGLAKLSKAMKIPLVATNDSHYTAPEDHSIHDVLLCIGTNTTVNDPKRQLKMNDHGYYVKSEAEMLALFPDHPGSRHQHAARRRAVQPGVRLRPHAPARAGDPERLHAPRIPHPPRARRPQPQVPVRDRRRARAPAVRARCRREDRLHQLLPRRPRHRRVLQACRHHARRARLRRGQRHPLRARRHVHRPARDAPRLRALPARRPQGAARRRLRHPRRPPRRGDPLRRREVRLRPRRADHHLRHHGREGRHPRYRPRPRHALRRRRSRRAPRAERAPHDAREGARRITRTRRRVRSRCHRPQPRRHRAAPGGRRASRQHARRRRRHLARPARRDRPAAAPHPRRRIVDPDDPVRDGAGRRDRPAQDGLPRPRQPHDPRPRRREHRAYARREDRPHRAARRRREDVRHARQRRHLRRLPARIARHAPRHPGAAPVQRLGARRARRALSPGPHAAHRRLLPRKARPVARQVPPRRPRRDPRRDVRRHRLPGPGAARDAEVRGLLTERRRRGAQSDVEEDRRADARRGR